MMTEGDNQVNPFQHLSFDEVQQEKTRLKEQQQQIQQELHQLQLRQQELEQHRPLQIALIDIKAAANDRVIRCIEAPLSPDNDLSYVALSYRWGQLHETPVDIGLDYLATVTSFKLDDFYDLCKMMTEEVDLQYINYVWVDGICVDQANPDKRNATIYQMSNIYDRANYILAVPDLHLESLRTTTLANKKTIINAQNLGGYIYQLILGDKERLLHIDYKLFNNDDLPLSAEKRVDMIETSMSFLMDLVNDWASRVWVISEYSIAKRRQKLKYWFLQLGSQYTRPIWLPQKSELYHAKEYSFFEFTFDSQDPPQLELILSTDTLAIHEAKYAFARCHHRFHSNMIKQLDQQTFLEKMLKSKASKNEDRFHSVFPGSKYKHILGSNDVVASWRISDLISVKLKLFEVMDTEDKLQLLFFSGNRQPLPDILPTFATANIAWPLRFEDNININDANDGGNFDLTDASTIKLMPILDTNVGSGYKLNLKPKVYLMHTNVLNSELYMLNANKEVKPVWKRLGLNDTNVTLCYVCIALYKETLSYGRYLPSYAPSKPGYIFLLGTFDKNIWILHDGYLLNSPSVKYNYNLVEGDGIGFDIY